MKTKMPDIQFYNVAKVKYCKIKIGSINIDVPVDDALNILVGIGLFAIVVFIIHAISKQND